MIEGLAARAKQVAGKQVEEEARRYAPIAVGAAVVTGAGALPVGRLIHAPIAELPGLKLRVESIRRATRAGLLAANHFQLQRLGVPGFGYGVLGVPYDEAARAIIDELRAFRMPFPLTVVLLDEDEEMLEALQLELGGGPY